MMNLKVDAFLSKAPKWRAELAELRRIILDCGLAEEVKWNVPVYTCKGKNIVGINGLKEYCALAFFKGALLKDPNNILVRPGNVQSARWAKFTSVRKIAEMGTTLKTYIYEAIAIENAGLKIAAKKLQTL